jgi:hypothetical protein
LDDCSAQVFPYNIFAYCSICRVDCKFARNKKKIIVLLDIFCKSHSVLYVQANPKYQLIRNSIKM